jgi:hypothetical protein
MTSASARSPKSSPNRSKSATPTCASDRAASLLNCRRRYFAKGRVGMRGVQSRPQLVGHITDQNVGHHRPHSISDDVIDPPINNISRDSQRAPGSPLRSRNGPLPARGNRSAARNGCPVLRAPSPQRFWAQNNARAGCGVAAPGVANIGTVAPTHATVVATHGTVVATLGTVVATPGLLWGRLTAAMARSCAEPARAKRPSPRPTTPQRRKGGPTEVGPPSRMNQVALGRLRSVSTASSLTSRT